MLGFRRLTDLERVNLPGRGLLGCGLGVVNFGGGKELPPVAFAPDVVSTGTVAGNVRVSFIT